MAETIDALVHRNLMDVFGQRDPALRARAIAEAYAPDVTFTDTDGVISGPEALGRKAQERLDGAPDFVFRPARPARHVGDMGLLAWAFGPEGKPPVVTGLEVSLVRDGRVVSVHTLVDGSP